MSAKKSLKKLFALAIQRRRERDEAAASKARQELSDWLPKSVESNLARAAKMAENGGGWIQIAGLRSGYSDIHPNTGFAHPRRDELLKELTRIGKSKGFKVIPSPPGVTLGWWMIWDIEAWEARDSWDSMDGGPR